MLAPVEVFDPWRLPNLIGEIHGLYDPKLPAAHAHAARWPRVASRCACKHRRNPGGRTTQNHGVRATGARSSPRARLSAGVVPSATCSRAIVNRRASTEKRQRPRLSALHRWNNQSSSLHDGARVAATSVAGSRVGEKCCAAVFSQKAVFRPPVADKVDVRLNASI